MTIEIKDYERISKAKAIQNPLGYNNPEREEIVEWLKKNHWKIDSCYVNGQMITWYEGDWGVHTDPGDWIVIDDGDLRSYSDKEFQETFNES